MHTKRIYLIVLTLFILIYKRGYCLDKHECLTWEINSNLLTLICRLTHFSEPVILIDNHEHEYIGCFFNEAINECLSRPKSHNITVDNSTNTVILTIEDVHKKKVNGKWKCKQGKNIYETEVSISKGIISATNLHISGVLQNPGTDSQVVTLTCYSCREPRKSNIEFSINGSSIDSIAYNKNTGHCTHKDGFCKPQDCFCDPSANKFTRLFYVTNANVIYFSCYASFLDNDKKSIFSMNVTILFNEKVFHYIGSETKVIKPPSQNYEDDNRTKSASLNTTHIENSVTDSKRTEIPVILWIVVGVSIIIVLVPPVILIFLCVRNLIILTKDSGKSKNNIDQTEPLLRESKESSPKSGTEGEMKEKTVDNIDRDGKPNDKETEPTISETNIEEIVDKTAYIANKSSEQANEVPSSENGSYISYANVVKNNYDEKPEDVPDYKDISESTHQKDEMKFDLAEDKYSSGKSKNNADQSDPLLRESKESPPKPGTEGEGEMNEKTVDNKDRDGKPSDKATKPTTTETNTEEIGDKTAYVENKSSDKTKQTIRDEVKSFKLADEATTSEYGSYISYENVVQNNSDEQPEEVPGYADISEDDIRFNLAEDEITTSGYDAKVVQNNFDGQQQEVPGSEDISESTLQKDVKKLNSAEDETTTSGYGAKVVQNNFNEQQEEVSGSEDNSESTLQKDVKELNSVEGETTTSGYGAKVVQNNFDEQQEEVPGSVDISESTLPKDVKELNSAEGTKEILNVRQKCVKTSSDVPACYLCHDCEEAVCECCKENHFQRHQFEKISSPLILMKITNCCGNHHDKEFEIFCRDHYSLCCVKCLIDDHRGCLNIASIVDASKEFKSHKVFDEYKTFLKTISKYFDNLKKILITGENDVQKLIYNHQSEIESNLYLYVEISHQKILKDICLEKVKHNKNTCLLELQKQISIVTKCKTDINTIETSLEKIWEQLPEEKLFLMVHLSNTILKSTWKKAISDSESINLVFTRMKAGGKYEMVETHKRILPQNLLKLIRRLEPADYGTQNGINSFPQFY